MDLQNYFNAQKAQQSLDLQADSNEIALLGNDLLEQIKEAFLDNYKVSVETAETQEESAKSLTSLTDGVKELVSNEQENASNLEASLANLTDATTKSMASNKSEGLVSHLKNTGSILKQMAKLAAKEYVQNTKYGKLWTNISKEMKKQGAAKTKVIEGKKGEEGGGGGGGDVPPLDSKLIAASMAMAAFKALNPVTMVMTFLTKVVPMLIVFGLLLYGFIKGYLNGTVADFIAGLVTVIVVAVLAYVAYMYVKEAIMFGIKVACEFMKVAIEATADWAAVYVIIAVIAIIAAAFLVAAVLVVVIIALAVVGIVIAMYFLTKAIQSMMEDMIEDIMEVFGDQLKEMKRLITEVISVFTTLVPIMSKMMTDTASTLKSGMEKALSGISATFAVMTKTMGDLANEISAIFNGLAAAILASTIGQAVKKQEEMMANATINSLTAQFETNEKMISEISAVIGEKISDVIEYAFSGVSDAVASFVTTVTDLVASVGASLSGVLDSVLTLFKDAQALIINQTVLLISKIIEDLNIITGAFLNILFGMPLIGWMMGLVGSNSFTKALEPLVENSRQIAALIADVLQAVSMKQNGIAKSTAITNTVTNAETSVIESGINTIVPTDTEGVNEETTTLKGVPSNFVTAQAFSLQMAAVRASMKDVVDAIYKTAPKDSKDKGLFSWW